MECPLAPVLSPTSFEIYPSSLFLLPPLLSADRARRVVRPTGIAISNDLRPGFSLAPRGTSQRTWASGPSPASKSPHEPPFGAATFLSPLQGSWPQ